MQGDGRGATREHYESAFAALNAAGIDALLLRDDLGDLEERASLELLVSRRDLDRAAQVLPHAGWELADGGLFRPLRRRLLRWDDGRFLELELLGAAVAGALVHAHSSWLASGAQRGAWNLLEPRPEAWLVAVLLRAAIEGRALEPRFAARARALAAGALDREQLLRQAGAFGLRGVMAALIDDPVGALADPAQARALGRRARRRLLLRPGNALRAARQALAWSAGRALGLRRGFLLAVVGIDGAGKTSFLAALEEDLERAGLAASTISMGPWRPGRLPTSRWLARLGVTPLDPPPELTGGLKRACNAAGRRVWYANAFLEFWVRYLGHVVPRLLARRIALADRYLHDLEVGYDEELVAGSPRLRRALVRLAPRPRLTLLLEHDAETIQVRGQTLSLPRLRAALRSYRRVAREHGLELLRTDRPPAALARAFLDQRWRELVRWRRDGLRLSPPWRRRREETGYEPEARPALRARGPEPELPRPLEVSWIETPADFERAAPEWDALVRRMGTDEPFLLSDFVLAWARHFGAGRQLRVAAVRAGGELVGGLPLYAEERRGRRTLLYPGAEDFAVANRTSVLAPRAFPQVVDALARALAAREDWDVLELHRLHLGPEALVAVERALARHGLLVMHQQTFPGYLVELPPTLEHYLARRSKSFRRKLRQADERAARLGGLRFVDVQDEADVQRLFARFVALSRASYRARGERSTFESERLCAFFADLLARFGRAGLLHAHALTLDQEPIAIGFGYSLRGNLNDVLSTFDPARAELMPGSLFTRAQLEHAIESGAAVLDFSSGGNPHKERWADRRERVHGLLIARPTLASRAAHRARGVARRVRGPR